MAISYRPYEPQQEMLMPALLEDWLPKGHLTYFISDTVDALCHKVTSFECMRHRGAHSVEFRHPIRFNPAGCSDPKAPGNPARCRHR